MVDGPAGVRLVLASASPRRAELLRSAGFDFDVRVPEIDETQRLGEQPVDYVRRLSLEKAEAAGRSPAEVVVAADTTVDLDGEVLGKPFDDADAARMLGRLSGRAHRVRSGVTIVADALTGGISTFVVTTEVVFADITADRIAAYVATGEPRDKAGSYAIQGAGAVLVARVDGSVSNVIGLPLAETAATLTAFS